MTARDDYEITPGQWKSEAMATEIDSLRSIVDALIANSAILLARSDSLIAKVGAAYVDGVETGRSTRLDAQ